MTDTEINMVKRISDQLIPEMAAYVREVYGFGSLDQAQDTMRRAFDVALGKAEAIWLAPIGHFR